MKRYELTLDVDRVDGTQTFAVMAHSELEARVVFNQSGGEFVSQSLEVQSFADDPIVDIEQVDEPVFDITKPKIKLTKTLPTEEGFYYWSSPHKSSPVILYMCFFDGDGDTDELCSQDFEDYLSASTLGGYWAKVDQSMFEIEG